MKPRGRPRDPKVRAAILKAARELLDSGGLTAVTMEGIAARAGVGKPTIYREWPNAHSVALSAFLEFTPSDMELRASASPIADLKQQLRKLAALFASRTGRGVTALIAATQGETELMKAFRHHFILKSRAEGQKLLERAVAAGDVRAGLNMDVALDLIYAPIYFRLLIGHAPLDSAFTDDVIDTVMAGLKPHKR
ncbi:MAG: TetR/AcrR family transcriptional regulator [Rhodospirillaceae bacterium]|nr:TetR/AcrR family transcriptional regulator [Rhodospirillaceae bacterium]